MINASRTAGRKRGLLSGLVLIALLFSGWRSASPQSESLRVGLHDIAPLAFLDEDGAARGFIVDVLEEIAVLEGWRLEYIHGSWQEGMDRLERGEIDLYFPMLHTPEREERFAFGHESIFSTWGRVFARRDVPVESILDLDGKSISVTRGDIFFHALLALTERFGLSCRFLEEDFAEDAFRRVAQRQADAVATERIDGNSLAGRYGLDQTPVVFSPGLAFFVTGRPPGPFLARIDRRLSDLKANPASSYHRAYERWVGSGRADGWPAWVRWLLIGGGVLLLGLIAFVVVLRLQVRSKTRELAGRNRQLEAEVRQRSEAEDELRHSLEEKEVLLKEIHHRVKNNLQVVSSLLRLQSRELDDERAVQAFRESQERVMSMALVHKELYLSDDFARVNLASYVRKLVDLLIQAHRQMADRIQVEIQIDDVFLSIEQAVPCGLILNELVTNAFQHAFPPLFSRDGRIDISLQSGIDREIELIVRDNGIGMPGPLDLNGLDSLGLKLIVTLVESQLRGSVRLEEGPGTAFRIRFIRDERSG